MILVLPGFSCNLRAPLQLVTSSRLSVFAMLQLQLGLWDVDISLSVIGKTVMVEFIVLKHFVDFFSIGDKDLLVERGTLRNTIVNCYCVGYARQ